MGGIINPSSKCKLIYLSNTKNELFPKIRWFSEKVRFSCSINQFAFWGWIDDTPIRVYFPFLHTLNLLTNKRKVLGARTNKKQRHLWIRNNGRLWKSRLWVFLEYIEITGSGAFKMKRKKCISSQKKLKTLNTSVWRLAEKQGLVRSDQKTVFRDSPISE